MSASESLSDWEDVDDEEEVVIAPHTRCDTCSKLSYGFFEEQYPTLLSEKTFFSIGSFERLYHSSLECSLCRVVYCHLMYQAISRPQLQWMLMSVTDIGLYFSDTDELILRYQVGDKELELTDLGNDVLPTVTTAHLARIKDKRIFNSRSGLHDGPLVMKWLRDCGGGHEECKLEGNEATALPTRVIDVGIVNDDYGSQTSSCRLIQSNGQHAEYLTLSHCWGDVRHDKLLTRTSMPSLLAGFADADLPKVFRDAVWLTRQLGKRYLWIDSLCIIQPVAGDDGDWKIEGSKMSDIYRNAYLTIAASSASNSVEGCLMGRLGEELDIFPVPLFDDCICRKHPVDGDGHLFGEKDQWLPLLITAPPSFMNVVQNGPLGGRAWVMQERMLSRRTLFVTVQGFFWECAHNRASVYEPVGCAFDYRYRNKGLNSVGDLLREEVPERLFGYHWRRIVEQYTSLGMTVRTDRLPAIAGLAKRLESCTSDTYIVGHWQSTLLSSLLWYRLSGPNNDNASPSRIENGAPSWSWASMSGAVKFTSLDTMDYPTRQVSDDAFAAAIKSFPDATTGSALKLQGRLRPMMIDGEGLLIIRKERTDKESWLGHKPVETEIGQLTISIGEDSLATEQDVYSVEATYDGENPETLDEVYMLQVLRIAREHNDPERAHLEDNEGLVLRRCEQDGVCVNERNGFFVSKWRRLFDRGDVTTVELV